MRSEGKLHRVKCHGCELKMTCSCSTLLGKKHIVILCPTCQVADFIDMLFGGAGDRERSDEEAIKPVKKKSR